jgi:hypothetical protein
MRARQSFVVVPLKNPPNLFGGGSAFPVGPRLNGDTIARALAMTEWGNVVRDRFKQLGREGDSRGLQ